MSETVIGVLLREASLKVSARDAEVLLAHCLQVTRAHLYAFAEQKVDADKAEQFRHSVIACAGGMPVSYLTGLREFWSLSLQVTQDTLIPRPETELLVETVLAEVKGEKAVMADCGTGSGAIALALASERPQWIIHAVDCSLPALKVASGNARRLHLANVHFHQGDWCDGLPRGVLDAIVSNPPYLAEDDPHLAALKHEPRSALVSGKEGLMALRCIAAGAPGCLRPGGQLFLEHGCTQGAAVRQILLSEGFENVITLRDLAGMERVTYGKMSAV